MRLSNTAYRDLWQLYRARRVGSRSLGRPRHSGFAGRCAFSAEDYRLLCLFLGVLPRTTRFQGSTTANHVLERRAPTYRVFSGVDCHQPGLFSWASPCTTFSQQGTTSHSEFEQGQQSRTATIWFTKSLCLYLHVWDSTAFGTSSMSRFLPRKCIFLLWALPCTASLERNAACLTSSSGLSHVSQQSTTAYHAYYWALPRTASRQLCTMLHRIVAAEEDRVPLFFVAAYCATALAR